MKHYIMWTTFGALLLASVCTSSHKDIAADASNEEEEEPQVRIDSACAVNVRTAVDRTMVAECRRCFTRFPMDANTPLGVWVKFAERDADCLACLVYKGGAMFVRHEGDPADTQCRV